MEEETNDDLDEVLFRVNLILVAPSQSEAAQRCLEANCTYVSGRLWLFEGDLEVLEKHGVRFEYLHQGVVGSLGGLTNDELLNVCKRAFDPSFFEPQFERDFETRAPWPNSSSTKAPGARGSIRIALIFADPTLVDDFVLAMPMVVPGCRFSTPTDADIVISDDITAIEQALAIGQHAIHYCLCADLSAHPIQLRRSQRYKLVLDEGGEGAPVLLQCVVDIARASP